MAAPNDRIGRPHLEFLSVSKTYDGRQYAVRDVDLCVLEGEFLTVLGPSGSGKTTILMMLAGFEQPTEGDIRLGGKSINRIPPFRRNIGVVFQNYALFLHKTVAENIAYPLRRRKLPRVDIERAVERMLKLVDLEGYGRRMPGKLSGGEQQRVALARALVFEPSLVLMDEPLGSLDRKLREQMQYELKRIHRTAGTTFIYVTHDQDEALAMSDHIAILDAGRIQQIGDPKSVYERPGNLFVASFIGENNVLDGRIRHVNGDSCSVSLARGSEIVVPCAHGRYRDQKVKVCIRPENLSLVSGAFDESNHLRGTLTELIYCGDHTRLVVDVPHHGPIVAKVAHSTVEPGLGPGSPIAVSWKRDHCVVLEEPCDVSPTGK